MNLRSKVLVALAGAAIVVGACTTGTPTGSGAAAGGPDGALVKRSDIKIEIVTHGQAQDGFWGVVRNGVKAGASQMGVTANYSAPGAESDMPGMVSLIDAAVAMIPGLAAQSRRGRSGRQIVLGNFELDALSAGVTTAPVDYAVIKGVFEPTDVGWAFWKYFMRTRERLADFGADLVFPDENDLVVDTASMDALSDAIRVAGAKRVLDFGTSTDVHHLNYFAQGRTAAFIGDQFGL